MFTHKMLRGNMTTCVIKCFYSTVFLTIFASMLGVHHSLYALFEGPSEQKYITYSVPIHIDPSQTSQRYEQEVSHLSEKLTQAYDVPTDQSPYVADWILLATNNTGVPTQLLASVIMTESSYDPSSVSSAGAVGLGQIRMQYWREVCPYADVDSRENVKCTAMILRNYYNTYCNRDWICALKVYNVGPGNYKKSKYFDEASKRYVTKILRNITRFKGQAASAKNIELAANF